MTTPETRPSSSVSAPGPSEPPRSSYPPGPSEPFGPTAPSVPSEPSKPTAPSVPFEPSGPSAPSRHSEPAAPSAPRRAWSLLIPLVTLLVLATRWYYRRVMVDTAAYPGFPLDDAWIHMTFARNFAEGNGLSFNPGVPSSGSTAPLWSVIIGILHAFSAGPPIGAVHLLGTLLAITTALLTFQLGLRLMLTPLMAGLAAVLVSLEWHLSWASLSGMEILLFSNLLLLTLLLYLRDRDGLPWKSALVCGLAATTRPEACVLFAVLMFDYTMAWMRQPPAGSSRVPWKGWIVAGLAFGLVFGIEVAWNLHADGRPLPQTFYAKAAAIEWRKVPRFLGEYISVFTSQFPAQIAVMAFAFVGILFQVARPREHRRQGFLLLFIAVFLLAYAKKRGGASYHGRYMQPMIPVFALYAARGFQALTLRISEGNREKARAAIAVVAALLMLQVNLSQARVLGENVRDVNEHVVSMGKWLAKNIPSTKKIAMSDIGALTYFTRNPVVDMRGLVSPFFGWDGPKELERERREGVDYVIVFPMFNQKIVRDGGFEPLHVHTVTQRTVTATSDLVVYRTYIREPRPIPLAGATGFDFESGTYDGWQIEGNAFKTPRRNKNKVDTRGPKEVVNLGAGKFLASSWLEEKDAPKGRLLSPPFTLEGSTLKLRVGGGDQPEQLRVALLVDGKVVRQETGPRSNVLVTRSWDVSALKGQQAQLEIVDAASGPWGHILVDQIVQYP